MLDINDLNINIKDSAKKIIDEKIKQNSTVLLALNDGSNNYSNDGGSCDIGTKFQFIGLGHADPKYSIKVKNNLGLNLYTSKDELQFLSSGLVLDAKGHVLTLSSDEGIIDGATGINNL